VRLGPGIPTYSSPAPPANRQYSAPVPVLRTISSDGTAIAYEAGGSGPSVVLVHGALSDRRHAFGAVRPLLERRVTVYALDRRGHGDSGTPPSSRRAASTRTWPPWWPRCRDPVDLVGVGDGRGCARPLEVENEYRFAPERYAEVTAPTLVLARAESAPSVRADAEAVAAGLPNARLTLLAGQRHGCLRRAPQLFADTVLDFLGH
jgi:pimeloyl-ACP methyl ester carboxylesterase